MIKLLTEERDQERLVIRSRLNSRVPAMLRGESSTQASCKPSSYLAWMNECPEKMELAVSSVKKGELSIRKAAENYGVPKSTLHDHVTGRIKPGATIGHPTYFTQEEENNLVKFIKNSASIGFPRTPLDVRQTKLN